MVLVGFDLDYTISALSFARTGDEKGSDRAIGFIFKSVTEIHQKEEYSQLENHTTRWC